MSDDIKGLISICVAVVVVIISVVGCTIQNYKETTTMYNNCLSKSESAMECAIVFDKARAR